MDLPNGPTIRGNWKKKAGSEIKKQCTCSRADVKAFVFSCFPFLTWTREYNWRKDSISDLIAVITVGIMSIPQGEQKFYSVFS
jgi:hypothetical protein